MTEGLFITAQEHQIFQVVSNVLSNAIDAIENLPEPTIYIELKALDGQAILRISDNGNGVPEELEEKIFDKLFTTKKAGTGIGLFEARQMIESYGGTLELNIAISRSCFEIKLPLT